VDEIVNYEVMRLRYKETDFLMLSGYSFEMACSLDINARIARRGFLDSAWLFNTLFYFPILHITYFTPS
jgi:hypothetical protein